MYSFLKISLTKYHAQKINDISSVLKQMVLKCTTICHNERPKNVITDECLSEKSEKKRGHFLINQQTSEEFNLDMIRMKIY